MTIRIDLVPLRPGGVNGGAGVLVRFLLDHLAEIGEGEDFVLLTAPWNHAELAAFARPGVSLLQMVPGEAVVETAEAVTVVENPLLAVLEKARHRLPVGIVRRALPAARRVKSFLLRQPRANPAMRPAENRQASDEREPDILFCPFTSVAYAEPGMKVISVFHDLQHRVYPQFFSGVEIVERDNFMARAAERADVIVCVSEFTRRSLFEHFPAAREKEVRVVPVSIHARLQGADAEPEVLNRYGLAARPYLFYPANFWLHKNHRVLLAAFGMLLARRPDVNLDLVFTGTVPEQISLLKEAVERMGLAGRVHFLGYLPDSAVADVYRHCTALIFPSLFEGFGIPLLEAFLFGKRVLCSRTTSLPEVGGDAAIYFDPRKPKDIVRAIETLVDSPAEDPQRTADMQARLEMFAPEKMMEGYRDVFRYFRHHTLL